MNVLSAPRRQGEVFKTIALAGLCIAARDFGLLEESDHACQVEVEHLGAGKTAVTHLIVGKCLGLETGALSDGGLARDSSR